MEAPEEDAEFLTLASPVQGVTLQVTPAPYVFGNGVEPGNHMSWSNHFGWTVIAQPSTGFSLFSLKALREAYKNASPHSTPQVEPFLQVPTEQTIDHIKFAMGDKLVVCGFRDGSLGVWRLKSLVEKNTTPLRTIPPSSPSPLLQVLPNPAPSSPLLCVLSSSTPPVIYNLETSSIHSNFPSTLQATTASWSVKGKQLVLGTKSGKILQFTPEGDLKAELSVPQSLLEQAGDTWEVQSLEWLENHVFLVTYSKRSEEGGGEPLHEDEVFVLTRDPKQGDKVEEVRFMDPTPAFGMMDRRGMRWISKLKNWEPFKHLLFISNAPSSDVGLLSQSSSSSSWSSLALSDTSRPTLPQSSSGEEVAPLALELDLSNTEEADGEVGIWCLTSEGVLVCWKVTNEKGGKYEGLIKSKDVLTQEQEDQEESISTPAPTSAPVSAPPSSAFGGGFGGFAPSKPSTTTTPNPTGFGSTGFGSTGFGSSASPAFGSSSIAAPSKPPTFGSTSGFGSFASSTPSPAATPPASTTGGFAGFGSTTSASSTPATSGFSAFGSGGTASTTASGGGGFGSFTKPATGGSVFGSGGSFGSSSASTTPSAFGSGGSAFGSTANKASSTTESAFGSGAGGFGGFSSSSPTTFGSTSSTSPAPKPSFSFAATPSSTPATPSGLSARPRGMNDSDDEQEEEMGQDDGGRVDEPPDLEPEKSGLDIGESMREAQEAKVAARASTGTFGFGGLGVGSTAKESSSTPASTTSIFGSTTPSATTKPAFGSTPSAFGSTTPSAFGSSPSSPAFGASIKPATGFSFGQQSPKPATPEEKKPEEEKKEESAPKPVAGFSFGSTSTPTSTFPKPATSAFGSSTGGGGFGAFSSSTGSGGFGSFAKKDEDKEGEKPKSAFSSFGTASGGFGSVKKPEEEPKKKEEVKTDEKKEEESKTPEPPAKSPFSFAAAPTPATPSESPKPAPATSAFGFGGTASTFPKPASTGGFGSFASSSGGFGSTTPKPATGFSFAPTASKPASPSPSPAPAPAFSFAPQPTTPKEEQKEEVKPISTKSLFGFASSPTAEKDAGSSLLSRLGAEKEEEEQSEGEGEQEEGESFEGSEGHESEYSHEEEQEDDRPGSDDDDEEEVQIKEEETEESIPPPPASTSGSPSLLPRLSPAPQPTAEEPPSPAGSPSPPTTEKEKDKPAAPSFSFGSAPSPSPRPASTTTPAKSPFSFATTSPAGSPSPSPAAKPPSTGFLGFTSSAPRSSSPLSAPPIAPPPAFSSAPKISSPLSFAPPSSEAPKSPFGGGFSGFGTAKTEPAKTETAPSLAPSPSFSFGKTSPAPSPSEIKPAPSKGGFSFGSSSPAAPVPSPQVKAPSAGFSFGGSVTPVVEKKVTPPPAQPQPPSTSKIEPVQPIPEVKKDRVSLSKATTPRVGPELVKGSAPTVQEKGMAGEFLKAYLGVQRDFEILRTNASVIKEFAKEVSKPLQEVTDAKIDWDDRNWSLGDLKRLQEITREIRPSVEALHGEAVKQKQKTAELQSQMLKAETKKEEAARFVRAKNDPAFAKMIRIRQLGPEQIENQRKIRLQMEAVRSRVEQLEEHLMALKGKVNEDQKGRSSFKAPSLDSVNRAVRNITVAVSEKTFELDQLAQRLDQVRLGSEGTPRRQDRHRSPSVALEETMNRSSVLRQTPAPSTANGLVTKSVPSASSIAAAKLALDTEKSTANLKRQLLELRRNQTPKINHSATAPVQGKKAEVAAELQLSFAKKGPITADRIPRPRRQQPPPSPRALSPIPLLPVFPSSPAPTKLVQTPQVETPKVETSKSEPAKPLSFASTPISAPPSFSFPSSSTTPSINLNAAPPAPPSFSLGGLNPEGNAAPLPLFPSLNLKSAPQISFSSTPIIASTAPSGSSSARSSASRTSKDRNHSSAAQLKPSASSTGGSSPTSSAAATFDWGPLPSSIASSTPSKTTPFSFATGGATPSGNQGISPSGFVSLGSPFTSTASSKPSTVGGFSFASSSTTTTPSKPAPSATPSFSFGAPPAPEEEEEEASDDQGSEEEEHEEGDYAGESGEDWGSEGYDDEEGLDTIGEEEEENHNWGNLNEEGYDEVV
ncbi:uncharacterized protein JCM6883_001299 [Sporobolomyces salmoneus]|uniref:uncharacterized protein n=1 Tax=Sporobolomyces salmoneus TaxID=183962 RepID=UPI00318285D3